jgi:sortase A
MARQLGVLFGLIILHLGTAACTGIVQIVPYTPTPNPIVTPDVPTNHSITASIGRLPARIVAKSIGLDTPIVEMGWRLVERWGEQVSEWNMPENEAAWHRNTAWPGEGSNIVISGHNASTGGQVFADLEELQIGDEITLWNENHETFVYQLIEKNIVRTFASSSEAQEYLRQVTEPTDKEQLTLITCWPRLSNTHRLIVIAEPKQG